MSSNDIRNKVLLAVPLCKFQTLQPSLTSPPLPAATHIYEIVPLGKQKAFYSNGDVSIGILFVMFLNTYGKNLWYKKKALLLL